MLIAILPAADGRPGAVPAGARGLGAEPVAPPTGASAIEAANAALARARDERRDLLLVAAAAEPAAGTLAELVAVARLDPMIGFVAAGAGDPAVSRWLPRLSYAVHARAGCLLVRHAMPVEFGLLDDGFATLDAALADLSLAANRCGYRAVVANRAHAAAPAAADPADAALLDERHPMLGRALERHAAGSHARAEALVAALAPDADGRRGLLFDCRMMHPFFSGTFEHARRLLAAFAARHGGAFRCDVLIDAEGWGFHRLGEIEGLHHLPPGTVPPAPHAVAFRLAQPFDREALALAGRAPVAGFLMLDTIALDCQHLDDAGLSALWQSMADTAGMLAFNSQFSRDQFARRFAVAGDVVQRVSLCSTDVADYAAPAPAPAGSGVLMVGNHYPHKALAPTLAALTEEGAADRTTVLGVDLPGAAAGHWAGGLPQALVDRLYDEAGAVLFPSHYEGFGLPVMNALARGKPVIARDLPCTREIATRTPHGGNIHLAADTPALAALAADPPAWDATATAAPAHDWGAAADAIADGFAEAISRFDFAACRRRQARLSAIARADAAEARAAALAATLDAERGAVAATAREATVAALLRSRAAAGLAAPATAAIPPPPRGRAESTVLIEDAPSGAHARLTIDARSAEATLAPLVGGLLDWAAVMAPGGRLRLLTPAGLGRHAALAALLAAGFRPDRPVRRFGRARVEGRLAARWTDLLAADADPAAFADFCHRLALGRPAGEGGGDASRRELLRGLLAADERIATILASIAG